MTFAWVRQGFVKQAAVVGLAVASLTAVMAPTTAAAQTGPLRIEITDGVIEPLPFAVPDFIAADAAATQFAAQISRVIAEDLSGTGLFREIPRAAYISSLTDFSAPVNYTDWKAINAQALITGEVSVEGNLVKVKFRGFDVFAGKQIDGAGLQLVGGTDGWRRIAHKVADVIYSKITW